MPRGPDARGPIPAGPHATVEEVVDSQGRGEIRVVVSVPFKLHSMSDAELRISAASLCLRGLEDTSGQEVCADMPAGFALDPDLATAKYSRKKQQLVVLSPKRMQSAASPSAGIGTASAGAPSESASVAEVAANSRGGGGGASGTLPSDAHQTQEVPAPAEQEEEDDDDDDDDLPPPLEATRSAALPTPSESVPAIASTAAAAALDAVGGGADRTAMALEGADRTATGETNSAADSLMQKALAAREAKQKQTEDSRKNADLASSGGLKKGFLSSGKKGPKSTKAAPVQKVKAEDEVPFITGAADPEAARREGLKLPEVQTALRQGTEALKRDQSWVTPELMNALQSKPELLAGLSNPTIQEAITLMQSDPQEAQRRYASNPEVSAFLKEFTSLMATHFDLLGKGAVKASPAGPGAPSTSMVSSKGSQDTSVLPDTVRGTSAPPAPLYTSHLPSDDPVAKALSDPKVSEAFQDAEVQALLAELRAGRPLEMRELCQQRPHLFRKLKALLDAGLLNLQA